MIDNGRPSKTLFLSYKCFVFDKFCLSAFIPIAWTFVLMVATNVFSNFVNNKIDIKVHLASGVGSVEYTFWITVWVSQYPARSVNGLSVIRFVGYVLVTCRSSRRTWLGCLSLSCTFFCSVLNLSIFIATMLFISSSILIFSWSLSSFSSTKTNKSIVSLHANRTILNSFSVEHVSCIPSLLSKVSQLIFSLFRQLCLNRNPLEYIEASPVHTINLDS